MRRGFHPKPHRRPQAKEHSTGHQPLTTCPASSNDGPLSDGTWEEAGELKMLPTRIVAGKVQAGTYLQ